MDNKSNQLRKQAKSEIRNGKKIDASLYKADFKVLVEELSIYQIELEHQNLELLKSQEELQQSKDRYLDLFDNAPISYLIVDSEGFIKDINQTACLLLESNKNKFIKSKITQFIHPDSQDLYYIYFRALVKQKQIQPCDIKLMKSNNTSFYAQIQGVCQSQISNDLEFRLAIIDVTIQKEMEFQLLKAIQQAKESDRLKSAFLANMSHEIRTPMNGILGFSEILKEQDLSGEMQKDYIEIIEKSGKRMLNIINDIVDISKIESGLIKLDIRDSNINEQIEYIYTFFKPEVEAKGIKLSFKTTLSDKEAIIKTDHEKVYAIITNLVKNAIKYSNYGSIEFGCKIVETRGIEFLQFYVKDTGIGIAANRQEAIFERFIQADISDKMARQGAGLGLAITKSYVEMLGGNIWVESQKDVGSTFYFTLPYTAEHEEKKVVKKVVPIQEEKIQIIPEVTGLKILIAEDDDISEKLITFSIRKFSKEILKAKTGFEAVKICRNNSDIDLIMMDILMPVLNGYEATRQIRQFNKDVIIIAQTAFGLSGDREKAIEAGCNDYISKPIIKEELFLIIQKYFNK